MLNGFKFKLRQHYEERGSDYVNAKYVWFLERNIREIEERINNMRVSA